MELKVFGGQASRELTEKICDHLGIKIGESELIQFADGEFKVRYKETIRGRDVYIVQSTYAPADSLMQLLLWIDAAKRAAAEKITAVIPYFGWARQDRKADPRTPISAKLVADVITKAGADRVLTVDLHSPQIQGFFDIPVDNLYARKVFVEFFKSNFKPDNFVVMGPDVGSAKLAESYIQRLGGLPIALSYKNRYDTNKVKVLAILGDVKDKNILLVDDMIDTAGTIVENANKLKEMGAKDIHVFATHGLFSNDAASRIDSSPISRIYVTDSIPLKCPSAKVQVISIASLLAEAIIREHNLESVSCLFE
ncbi:MAG: ribose-phosphate pyrophosphokinase [bacterium]|nr:ribose-phosphate pyrophosphokinase [bacterium]